MVRFLEVFFAVIFLGFVFYLIRVADTGGGIVVGSNLPTLFVGLFTLIMVWIISTLRDKEE